MTGRKNNSIAHASRHASYIIFNPQIDFPQLPCGSPSGGRGDKNNEQQNTTKDRKSKKRWEHNTSTGAAAAGREDGKSKRRHNMQEPGAARGA